MRAQRSAGRSRLTRRPRACGSRGVCVRRWETSWREEPEVELREQMGPFEAVNYYFERAADLDAVPEQTRAVLRMPAAELRVEVPLRRDNGDLEVYVGYRVQHDNSRG